MSLSDQENEYEHFPVQNAIDIAILMHREAHFSGSFEFMLEYYQTGGKGVCLDFDIPRIQELADMEKRMQQNMAAMLLTGADAEKVAKAKEAYKKLRELYEIQKLKHKYPILIADLILSEDELPEKEIQAIVAEKGAIVPSLIELVCAEDYYDPLFPGYGLAPTLAAKCLGLIGDKRAMISLFELIGERDVANEEVILEALKAIGEPAKAFLLKVLHGKPINQDNENAAIALIEFKDDPEVATQCFKMLKEVEIRKHPILGTYLALACEGLDKTPYKEEFLALAQDPNTPKILRQDILAIAQHWKNR